ncbi:MAG: acetate--CoA ligase family protein [Chloroflexota bacterium]|nr:acetate--CoA ligase family protein [Chloroflexota bacterium]MDE3101449.1 acetate--CoA ligase family protein [Chloroflexota bacterium]
MSSARPDLRPILGASSVAIVGASERNYYTRSVFENLRALGFPLERIRLVNPNRPEAFGQPCVARLDGPVDLAVVATPRATVPGVLRELAGAGVRACVVLSDGFAESGAEGAALQAEVASAAAPMLLVGPNTMGVVVPGAGVGAWGAVLPPLRDGDVSLLFQSSGLLNLFMNLVSARRIGIRAAISVGNEAGVTYVDHLRALVEDERTRVVASFIESVADGRALREVLERADELGKTIVALRVGRSERARRNVLAHTGRLAASGAVWDALFRQTGVVAVANVDELLETVALFSRARKRLEGDGVGLVTISGGDCTLLSDLAARVGVRLPEPARRAELAELVGKPTLLGNPLDVEDLLRTDPERFFRALELLASDREVAVVGVRLNLPERPTDALRASWERAAAVVRGGGKLAVALTRASEALAPEWHALFDELGVPLVEEYEKALGAIRSLVSSNGRRARAGERVAPIRRSAPADLALPPGEGRLSVEGAARLLAAYGIPFTETIHCGSADASAAAADRLGYPVVLKADVAHKSDLGAVRADLRDAAAVREAYTEVARLAPGAGILVQHMEKGVAECLVGVTVDERLGPVLAVGLGGIFVETLKDVSLRLPPLREADVREMLDELRGVDLLRGVRGREPADLDALVDLVLRVSEMAVDLDGRLSQLDLNPVIVRGGSRGAVAVDALVALA